MGGHPQAPRKPMLRGPDVALLFTATPFAAKLIICLKHLLREYSRSAITGWRGRNNDYIQCLHVERVVGRLALEQNACTCVIPCGRPVRDFVWEDSLTQTMAG